MRSSAPTPWKRREKRAPLPNSSSRPSTRSWAISSSGWFITGVPVEREPQRALRHPVGEPAHRLRALGARVLDVVGLVEHERLRLRQRQPRAVGVDDVVVEDRDVGELRRGAGAGHDRDRALGQPALGLALPVELQARRADHHRRVGVVGLQRGQRLDRLAEPLLVGQERPPRLQRVGDAGALERPQLAAERGLDLQRRPVVRPRAADVDDRARRARPAGGRARRRRSRRPRPRTCAGSARAARAGRGRPAASGRAPRRRAARGRRGSSPGPSSRRA